MKLGRMALSSIRKPQGVELATQCGDIFSQVWHPSITKQLARLEERIRFG